MIENKIENIHNLIGKRFGRLTVIDYADKDKYGKKRWICSCDCGNQITVREYSLTKETTKSCGCLRKELQSKKQKKYNTYDLSGEYGIGYTSKGEEFWFDKEDYNKIKNYCWHINNKGYVVASDLKNSRKSVKMHRVVIENANIIDHKNHKKYDNRKSNLRNTTQQTNCVNRSLMKNNKSGATGVIWNKSKNKWESYITYNKKRMYLGQFDNFNEAVKVRKKAESKYFGNMLQR